MRFQGIAFTTLFFGATVLAATELNERFIEEPVHLILAKRQQFKPQTTTAEGATCADAFGKGYETCRNGTTTINRLCYNPTLGQICCSDTWACPASSFCLVNGSCCPQGQDPKVCAKQNGQTISSDFPTSTGSSSKPTKTGSNSAPSSSSASSAFALRESTEAGSVIGLVGLLAGAMALL